MEWPLSFRAHVGSHNDEHLEVTQVSCTPHFADGETDTYSRNMTGLGYRLESGGERGDPRQKHV